MVDVVVGNNPLFTQNVVQVGPLPQAGLLNAAGGVSINTAFGTSASQNLVGAGPFDLAQPAPLYMLNPSNAAVIRSMFGQLDQAGRGPFGTVLNVGTFNLTIQNNTPDVLSGGQRKILTHTGADFVLASRRSVTLMLDAAGLVYWIVGVT